MHGFINITSMATPSVAGAAAILVQYLNEGGYDESIEVKASLIKAMLVHSSVTLKGYCTRTTCKTLTRSPNTIKDMDVFSWIRNDLRIHKE